MTLLLATVSHEGVLITADGLSIVESLNAPGRTTLQKIFPVPSRPVAISQCGRNFLKIGARGEVSIGRAIAEWCDSELPQTVRSIAECLNKWIRTADNKFFGPSHPELWVAGYSEERCQPDLYVLTNQGLERREESSATGGVGGDLLRGKHWSAHPEAWEIAMAAQEQQTKFVFGGHRHQLRITPATWTWVEKPKYGSLGIEGEILTSADIPTTETLTDPRCFILSARDELQTELCRRALRRDGKHPRKYGGAKEHWKAAASPDWRLTDRLIAICDEARFAHPSDVSAREALLYRTYVRRVIGSLPDPIDEV